MCLELSIAIRAIIFDLSFYGLVRRLKTSPAFRLVNDKSIDAALYRIGVPVLRMLRMISLRYVNFFFFFVYAVVL